MDDNEKQSSKALIYPCATTAGKMLRMVFINPRIDEDEDGRLLTNIIISKEGAEALMDVLAEKMDEIWG